MVELCFEVSLGSLLLSLCVTLQFGTRRGAGVEEFPSDTTILAVVVGTSVRSTSIVALPLSVLFSRVVTLQCIVGLGSILVVDGAFPLSLPQMVGVVTARRGQVGIRIRTAVLGCWLGW